MFPTILVVRYIVAIWQIHKVTPSIMSFMNSHCGSNFTAEHGSTIKEKEKKSWKYSTQTHTSHTRVLHGELSWEGKQFHLRELWRPTLGRLDWSRATEAGCILMTGCLCGSVLGKDGGCCIHVCMSGGVKGRACYCRASETDGVFSGDFEQERVKGLQAAEEVVAHSKQPGDWLETLSKIKWNAEVLTHVDTLCCYWCDVLWQDSLEHLFSFFKIAKNCNITIRIITVTRAWLLCNNCYYIVICLLTFTCRHFTIHKSKRYWIRL